MNSTKFEAPLPWQAFVLSLPEEIENDDGIMEPLDVILPGSRGGGKSVLLVLLAISHIQRALSNGTQGHVIVTRISFPALRAIINIAHWLIPQFFPNCSWNKQDSIYTIGHCTLTFAYLQDWTSVQRAQGAEYSLAIHDEAQAQKSPEYIDLLSACLRLRPGGRMVLAFNSGDKGQQWLCSRYTKPSNEQGTPFIRTDNGRLAYVMPSFIEDNKHLPANYRDTIIGATKGNLILQHQWLTGDLSAVGGLFMSAHFKQHNYVSWPLINAREWSHLFEFVGGCDWGSAAPAVAILGARAKQNCIGPDGLFYPMNSWALIGEHETSDEDDRTKGTHQTVQDFCKAVRELWQLWQIPGKPKLVVDSAVFADLGQLSIGNEMRANGINVIPSNKGRRGPQFDVVKERGSAAENRTEAGLFIDHRCKFTILCIQSAATKANDISDCEPDFGHALDALRYLIHKQNISMSCDGLNL